MLLTFLFHFTSMADALFILLTAPIVQKKVAHCVLKSDGEKIIE